MTSQADILDELGYAQQALESAVDHYAQIRLSRNEYIQLALEAGVKQAEIARLTGLSRARIAQLK